MASYEKKQSWLIVRFVQRELGSLYNNLLNYYKKFGAAGQQVLKCESYKVYAKPWGVFSFFLRLLGKLWISREWLQQMKSKWLPASFVLYFTFAVDSAHKVNFGFCSFRDGNLPDIITSGSLHEFLVTLHEKYGSIVSFWFGRRLVVSLGSVDLLKQHINPNRICKFNLLSLICISVRCGPAKISESFGTTIHWSQNSLSVFMRIRVIWNWNIVV